MDKRLNFTPKKEAKKLAANIALIDIKVDELLEFNEFGTEHLLLEDIEGIFLNCRNWCQKYLFMP